jgi:hypothetical protein
VPAIDVVDSTWLPAPAGVVAGFVADPANWPRWWPGLVLDVDESRGDKGVRWFVLSVGGARDQLAGSAEVWLEPMLDGVVAHFFLRLDPPPGRRISPRLRRRVIGHFRRATKEAFWALGDQLDPTRLTRHAVARPPGREAQLAVSRPRAGDVAE